MHLVKPLSLCVFVAEVGFSEWTQDLESQVLQAFHPFYRFRGQHMQIKNHYLVLPLF